MSSDEDTSIEFELKHDCVMQPSFDLRWRRGLFYNILPNADKLEQALKCIYCGKTEWLEVPIVKEEV